jgi:hypothetical protein
MKQISCVVPITQLTKILAVVYALKFLSCYLEGTNFIVLKYYTFLLNSRSSSLKFDHQFDHQADHEFDNHQQFDHKWELMPGVNNPAYSLSCLGDPSMDTILYMIGMIRSSFPKYNSIHNKSCMVLKKLGH